MTSPENPLTENTEKLEELFSVTKSVGFIMDLQVMQKCIGPDSRLITPEVEDSIDDWLIGNEWLLADLPRIVNDSVGRDLQTLSGLVMRLEGALGELVEQLPKTQVDGPQA